jgi:hypothetical protein
MKAKLYSHKLLIGETELSVTDESMGVISGNLITNNEYRKLQPVFLKGYNNDDVEFRKLKLNLQLENGCFISPFKIWVEEFEDFPNEVTVYGLGINRQVIEDYFISNPPKLFVEEPWYVLRTNQKIGLEEELLKEIGNGKVSFWDRLRNKSVEQHKLVYFNCSAYANYGASDDILFEVESENSDYTFAVVHLTYSGKKEKFAVCPHTDFYRNFDEFKKSRMFPDRIEWES